MNDFQIIEGRGKRTCIKKNLLPIFFFIIIISFYLFVFFFNRWEVDRRPNVVCSYAIRQYIITVSEVFFFFFFASSSSRLRVFYFFTFLLFYLFFIFLIQMKALYNSRILRNVLNNNNNSSARASSVCTSLLVSVFPMVGNLTISAIREFIFLLAIFNYETIIKISTLGFIYLFLLFFFAARKK